MSARLRNYWENFDIREGVHWLDEFLQRSESKAYPIARAKALYAQGWNLSWFHRFDEAQSMAEECLALYRAAGDPHGEVDGLNLLGGISIDAEKRSEYCQQALELARSLGDVMRQSTALNLLGWDHRDFKRAFAYWEEAVTLYRQIGGWRYLASVLSMLGYFLVMEGEIESAQKYLDESNLLYQKLKTKRGKSHLLIAYGQIALMHGDFEKAREYFQDNAKLGNDAGSRMDYLWSRVRLGFVELRAGNFTEAREIFNETARNFHRDGSKSGVMYSLEGVSSLYVAIGKPEIATRMLGWADAVREEIGAARPILEQSDVDRDIAAIVANIGKDAFDAAYDRGRAMTLDEAVAYALDEG
jgi:tetratricopeptide (TPR) repeat protein